MQITEFQKLIEAIYYEKDAARGLAGTHMWFCEEVGELTRALRRGQHDELEGERLDAPGRGTEKGAGGDDGRAAAHLVCLWRVVQPCKDLCLMLNQGSRHG